MAREFFKNLPNTTTPLTAPRMNALLDGDEAMGNIVVDSVRSKNLFNLLSISSGGINNSTGEVISTDSVSITSKNEKTGSVSFSTNAAWRGIVSDYIEVESGATYILSLTSSSSSVVYFGYFYNSSEQFMGGSYITQINPTITIPSNAKYMKIVLETNTTNVGTVNLSNIQLEKGNTATTFAPYQNLNGYEIYLTAEQIIGKWIDNSKLYRKVIEYSWDSTIGNASGVTNISIPHNISSFRALINLYATIQGRYSLPIMGSNATSLISAVDNTNVNFRIINDTWGANTITIILEYVKN